jgi:hypothetical protein
MRWIIILIIISGLFVVNAAFGDPGYWQQRIYCQMHIDFEVKTHQYQGTQKLVYFNQSPDTLTRLYYHLYFNAFQEGSEMHQWNMQLPDPDTRIVERLSGIKPEDAGFMKVQTLTQDGESVVFKEKRTILEVHLKEPLLPGQSTVMDMQFLGQVPIQIRRSGRDSHEGVDYSMTQWFPKICNYDRQGWHANPYIQREFYGVWGDYDVRIEIDKRYILGATGYLQNAQTIGYGYEDPSKPMNHQNGDKITWHFFAPNVHDFAWAADPDYTHRKATMDDGTVFHFLYLENKDNREAWSLLPEYMNKALTYINAQYGDYPYRQYSIIQGGDGGMEYPMATLITGNRPLSSLVGVSVHELMHSWYQGVLATDEARFAWMDEGFTSFASSEVMSHLFENRSGSSRHAGSYRGYFGLVQSGYEEPLTTYADHFLSNFAYGAASYNKGAIFLNQLGYVIGQEALDQTMLNYYHQWQFKHPTSRDFIRVAEKTSGLELDWYHDYWVNTTRTIDYSIDSVWSESGQIGIRLSNAGTMPMPVDIAIKEASGRVLRITIPLDMMLGFKRQDAYFGGHYVAEAWPWALPTYTLMVPGMQLEPGLEIYIDPSQRMADIEPTNNRYLWQGE